ncbi:major facilitator superfamily domain-containing protein [Aspergillus floccosus]
MFISRSQTLRWNGILADQRCSSLFITSVVAFATFTDSFLYGLFVPVTPTALTDRVGLFSEDVQVWNSTVVAVQAATTSAMCPIVGYLADRTLSRRRPLLGALALSATGTALLCVGDKLALWMIGRMLQGAGTAFVNTIGVVLLVDTVGSESLGQYLGYLSFGLAAGMPTGPLLGGILYEKAGYYSVFIIAFALIGVDAILCAGVIKKRHVEQVGEIELEMKATQDCFEMVGPNDGRFGKCCSVHMNTGLPDINEAGGNPRLPATLSLITSPRILICMWNYCLTAVLSTAFDAVLPIYVRDVFHWSQMGSGLVFLTLTLPLFFDPVTGIMCDRWPRAMRYMSSAGLVASMPVLVSLRFVVHNTIEHKVLLCVLLSLVGFISSFVQIPAMLEVNRVVKEKEDEAPGVFGRCGAVAQAYGLCTGSYALGGIVGPLFAGFIREYAGWKTMSWALATVSGASAIPTYLLLGGWIYQK